MKTKLEILDRLIKEGSISLEEAFILNEKEYVYPPIQYTPVDLKHHLPYNPYPTYMTFPDTNMFSTH
jgi:hypothetical protein